LSINDIKPTRLVHGFRVERADDVPELRSRAIVCTHEATGARLVHCANDDPNNLFCIAFRTPVCTSTGVPHILEHSVLAGSRKFPLKDPFKELLKGSLQTFLNALTYPDRTVYPVSSQVEADFFNCVDVYCDAVLNPLLSEETFGQEGWHFDVPDASGPVGITGIVYNEMKGVFSDFRSHVARRTIAALLPDTTYAFDSGGDPEHIPELTYEQFVSFHRAYYHPSNSFIFLYGNIPTDATLAFLHDRYLHAFGRRPVDSTVAAQPPWAAPRRVDIRAPAPAADDGTASVIVSWIFGDSTDPLDALLGSIVARYLLDTESSPLKRALIDSGLGEDLDDMCGFDPDLIQGIFLAGLRKTRPEHASKIETLVLDTLRTDIGRGLDTELLEGALRRTEFALREIRDTGHFPYNLLLAERCFRSWMYGGDPLAHLKFDKPLAHIKAMMAGGTGYVAGQIRSRLLDNPHRCVTVVSADASLGDALGKLTESQAQRLTTDFGPADRKKHADFTRLLREYQTQPPSAAALASIPHLKKTDLPAENQRVPFARETRGEATVYTHPLFTSGIIYADIGFDLGVLPADLLSYFPLYAEIITRCGAGNDSVERMAKRVSLNTGGIHCSHICSVDAGGSGRLVSAAVFHGKALEQRAGAMVDILADLFTRPRLDDPKLVGDTLREMRNSFNAAVVSSGHVFAGSYSASRLCPSCAIVEQLEGITQLRFLDRLVRDGDTAAIIEKISALHHRLVQPNGSFVSMTVNTPDRFIDDIDRLLSVVGPSAGAAACMRARTAAASPPAGIRISASVNFVAQVWPLDGVGPDTIGMHSVLAKNLSTGYLWEKIRVEGGAYGGKASVGSSHPVFTCASYRDPNVSLTLANFRGALEHVAAGLAPSDVEQNVIACIGGIDSPKTPHAKGLSETVAQVCGRTAEYRQAVRDTVLAADPHSLAACARRILDTPETSIAVLGSDEALAKARDEQVPLSVEPLL
jgi:hypothetical protein